MVDIEAEMARLVAEVTKVIESKTISWEHVPVADEPAGNFATEAYKGHGGGWVFTVVSFNIEDQGFPPGSRGHDGAATRDGTILRLPRDLAEKALKQAEKAVEAP
jgi:hypothetical protein